MPRPHHAICPASVSALVASLCEDQIVSQTLEASCLNTNHKLAHSVLTGLCIKL